MAANKLQASLEELQADVKDDEAHIQKLEAEALAACKPVPEQAAAATPLVGKVQAHVIGVYALGSQLLCCTLLLCCIASRRGLGLVA